MVGKAKTGRIPKKKPPAPDTLFSMHSIGGVSEEKGGAPQKGMVNKYESV